MAAIRNVLLERISIGQNDQWRKVLPWGFVRGSNELRVKFLIYTKNGGPWEVHAERTEGQNVYAFGDSGWHEFYNKNSLTWGSKIVFWRDGDFVLYAMIFEPTGEPAGVTNHPDQDFDCLVMLTEHEQHPQPTAIGEIAGGASNPSWTVTLEGHHWFNFEVNKVFIEQAALQSINRVTLTLNRTNVSREVTVEEKRGKWYFKNGMKEFLLDCGPIPGDKVTFTYMNPDQGILVHIEEDNIDKRSSVVGWRAWLSRN